MAFRKPSGFFVVLLFLLCSIFFPRSVAKPYVVSGNVYEYAKCYLCSTVLDESDNVYLPLADEDTKPCAAANRTKLYVYRELCHIPDFVCTTWLTIIGSGTFTSIGRPANGFQSKTDMYMQWVL